MYIGIDNTSYLNNAVLDPVFILFLDEPEIRSVWKNDVKMSFTRHQGRRQFSPPDLEVASYLFRDVLILDPIHRILKVHNRLPFQVLEENISFGSVTPPPRTCAMYPLCVELCITSVRKWYNIGCYSVLEVLIIGVIWSRHRKGYSLCLGK